MLVSENLLPTRENLMAVFNSRWVLVFFFINALAASACGRKNDDDSNHHVADSYRATFGREPIHIGTEQAFLTFTALTSYEYYCSKDDPKITPSAKKSITDLEVKGLNISCTINGDGGGILADYGNSDVQDLNQPCPLSLSTLSVVSQLNTATNIATVRISDSATGQTDVREVTCQNIEELVVYDRP
jgi:hypothetical protein